MGDKKKQLGEGKRFIEEMRPIADVLKQEQEEASKENGSSDELSDS